jgi:general secretion pathway protein C
MLLQFDQRARRLLRQLPRRYAYTGAELLLLTFLALQLARLTWALLTPVEPLGDWRTPSAVAAPAESAVLRDFDPFFRTASDGGPVMVTSLNLNLLGTRVDTVSGRGSAIIDAGGVQASFLVGEAVMPGVTLEAVDFDNVTISRGGTREKLYLDQSAAPGALPSGSGASPLGADPATGAAPPLPPTPGPAQ